MCVHVCVRVCVSCVLCLLSVSPCLSFPLSSAHLAEVVLWKPLQDREEREEVALDALVHAALDAPGQPHGDGWRARGEEERGVERREKRPTAARGTCPSPERPCRIRTQAEALYCLSSSDSDIRDRRKRKHEGECRQVSGPDRSVLCSSLPLVLAAARVFVARRMMRSRSVACMTAFLCHGLAASSACCRVERENEAQPSPRLHRLQQLTCGTKDLRGHFLARIYSAAPITRACRLTHAGSGYGATMEKSVCGRGGLSAGAVQLTDRAIGTARRSRRAWRLIFYFWSVLFGQPVPQENEKRKVRRSQTCVAESDPRVMLFPPPSCFSSLFTCLISRQGQH